MKINADILARPGLLPTPEQLEAMYRPPRTLGLLGAAPEQRLAMDAALGACDFHSLLTPNLDLGLGFGLGLEGIAPRFLGYPALAGLAQNPLIRAGVTTVADEMSKRWVEVRREGEPGTDADHDGRDDRVQSLVSALDGFGLQGLFNDAAQRCDFDGGCLIYIDTGEDDEKALRQELFLDGALLRGKLKRFTLVEAINLYPGPYNTVDPLCPGYFRPDSWFVMGRLVHKSRFLYFAPNQLPVLLRPAYNFFGIPAAQAALDYVAQFTKTREAAQRLLTKFSLTVFKSDIMDDILSGSGAEDVDRRMRYLAQHRDNDAILLIDKEREDVIKLETSLAGVTDIVRQSLEFVAAVFRIPFVKFLGISPGGLNATGEADLRNFYDHVAGKQEKILRRPLDRVLALLQLHLFGEASPEIKADFVPLTDEDDAQKAITLKTEADRDAVYLDRAVLEPDEVRKRLAEDAGSGYAFIEQEMAPEVEGEQETAPEVESEEREAGEAGAPPALETEEAEENVQSTSLNGAQITSMVDIVAQVARGELPRDSGINILLAAFPIAPDVAEKIMGEAGRGFVPSQAQPQGGGGFPGASDSAEPLLTKLKKLLGMGGGNKVAYDDNWVTVKPNGPDAVGRPVLLGEGGEVKAGMGGKFKGQKLSEIPRTFENPKYEAKKAQQAAGGSGGGSSGGSISPAERRKQLLDKFPNLSREEDKELEELTAQEKLRESEEKIKRSKQLNQPTYLKVPFADNHRAKKAGARWDPDSKQWYMPAGQEVPSHLKQYQDETSAQSRAWINTQLEGNLEGGYNPYEHK
ncbi:MAG: DUF1073 domain-containing protein [Desulfovibrio sp.]|jgi:phage-related protein (TIGR01555 family)|nr:DUF1073 domain-containing protein [Desulfovibrio sp.]